MDEHSLSRRKPGVFLTAALLSYLIGYLWVCCFLLGFSNTRYADFPTDRIDSWYPLLFAVCFFLWGSLLFAARPVKNREHLFWLACAGLIALAMALGRCRAVSGWGYLALHGCAGYWVLCRSGMLTEGGTSEFLPYDLLEAFVIAPFGGLFLRLITLFHSIRCKVSCRIHRQEGTAEHWKKTLIATAAVMLLALPVFLLAGKLLGQADETFAGIWEAIGTFFTFSWESPRWITTFLQRFLLGLPVGAYLFGLAGGSFRREKPRLDGTKTRQSLNALRFAPAGALITVFGAFIALYILFFAVQAGHLLGAFRGDVPGRLTASEYARQGFFQLVQVMMINFALLGAAALLGKVSPRENRVLRILAAVVMVQSVFLAVTAASKLGLYIRRFGFTPLRLLSVWGILVLTAGCVLTVCGLRKPCHAARKWVWFTAATFTVLCFY